MDIDTDEMWQCFYLAKLERDGPPVSGPPPCTHEETYKDVKQGGVVCQSCGMVVDSILCDIFGNTLPTRNIKPRSLYRRRHHFNERLSQWLVTTKRVPDSVVRDVAAFLADGTGPVTKTRIRAALRHLHQAKHIENWLEIYCDVTGRPYPTIPAETLERIREHFLAIEYAFEKNRPEGRKCILSYNFIMSRLLQIYGLNDHQKYFPPLKSRAKLKYLDEVWVTMAKTMGLPPIPPPMYNKTLR